MIGKIPIDLKPISIYLIKRAFEKNMKIHTSCNAQPSLYY